LTQRDKIKEAELKGSDPSALTTQMIWREIAALKELLTSELDALKKGIDVAHEDLVRVPTDVQKQVGTTKELLIEKIDAINKSMSLHVAHLEKQFDTIEKQRVEQKTDTRTAVDDALKAAKELVFQQNQANNMANAKSEAAFSKHIDQLATLLTSEKNASNDRITDLKERLDKSEGKSVGIKDYTAIILAVAGLVIGAVAIIISLT
jgi:hypothetical protein